MSNTLEAMRKDYKDDADIINELTNTPEAVVDFDRTWNGKYEFVRCGECNGPMLGHRAEKCRKSNGYEEVLVKKYETSLRSTLKIREIVITYINKQKMAEIEFKQDRELELAKNLPAKTSLMIGRTEIPKWIGQEFEVWKKELEKWDENDKSSDETKYCNVLESLKKNDKIKDFVHPASITAILDVPCAACCKP